MAFNVLQEQADGSRKPVQQGLSAGEARQVILDHVHSDIHHVSEQAITRHIAYLSTLHHDLPERGERDAVQYVEDILYDEMSDDQLVGTRWEFEKQVIYVE